MIPSYLAPLVLRFDGAVPSFYWHQFVRWIGFIAILHVAVNAAWGLYGPVWRYASVVEARKVIVASIPVGGVLVFGAWLMEPHPLPLSVLTSGAFISMLAFGAVRFQSRLFAFRRRAMPAVPTRVLVVGAGDGGAAVLKDLVTDVSLGLRPVAIVDDDPSKRGRTIHGVPILGGREDLGPLIERFQVDRVLLTIPSATDDMVRDIAEACEGAGVGLQVLPSVRDIVGNRASARDIRDVNVEDLLGRRQVETDLEAVAGYLSGRRVLITGAGGSIGSEIARQVAGFEPEALLLLDHDESLLHECSMGLETPNTATLLADVRDRERMLRLFAEQRPQVVFHAAAHKHVPVLEDHPSEAVLTNILGTAHVVDAAVTAHVERFVLVSTDKAVRPASVMGASKWFAEQIVRSVQERECTFCAVRFGNVLGSRGSVVPTFFRQIAAGGPVTVTHPSMLRYFMSLREAVQLVLQAGALSKGGEVLTLEMGQPVSILDLASKLIRLSGRVPGRDVLIEFVGARPGEKLVEDLLDPDEEDLPSLHPGITMSRPAVPDQLALRRAIRELETLVQIDASDELRERIKQFATEGLRPLAEVQV